MHDVSSTLKAVCLSHGLIGIPYGGYLFIRYTRHKFCISVPSQTTLLNLTNLFMVMILCWSCVGLPLSGRLTSASALCEVAWLCILLYVLGLTRPVVLLCHHVLMSVSLGLWSSCVTMSVSLGLWSSCVCTHTWINMPLCICLSCLPLF